MPYPRFTKVNINHFLSIHTSVPKALSFGLHTIEDDGVLSQMKFVKIGKDVQKYGRAIPDAMLTDDIKQSENIRSVSPKPASDEEYDESDAEPAIKQTGSRIVIKKKMNWQ
ncbi:hypothetical protein Tco_0651873 [Tanacetum coccineum]|uniref:Uncharacterized protein n=1 Tax=Tanacetum coccineum TaxID=301880 RepID=A0ABQ4WVZ8_9ASTR